MISFRVNKDDGTIGTMANKRLILTLPDVLRRAIKKSSEHRHCSQAEIIRSSLYVSLKEFIEEDNPKKPIVLQAIEPKPNNILEVLRGLGYAKPS